MDAAKFRSVGLDHASDEANGRCFVQRIAARGDALANDTDLDCRARLFPGTWDLLVAQGGARLSTFQYAEVSPNARGDTTRGDCLVTPANGVLYTDWERTPPIVTRRVTAVMVGANRRNESGGS